MTSATMNQTQVSSMQGIQPQKIVILGSTGSIGQNALRVVRQLGPIAEVIGLSAQGQNLDLFLQQILKTRSFLSLSLING
jgi:1-deoxy-D-xylulose 5-phosphate reductoisomerase